MQEIHCGAPTTNDTRGHFLARINGAQLELYCPKCKEWHRVPIVELVRGMAVDLQNGNDPEGERRLIW